MKKVRLNITISQEARNFMGDSPSQYIEELLTGDSRNNPPKSEEKGLTEGRVLYLIQQELAKVEKKVSAPVVAETGWQGDGMKKACCLSKTPCKHWTFDGDEGDWVNTISGERRKV